jgi:hypothetical protein
MREAYPKQHAVKSRKTWLLAAGITSLLLAWLLLARATPHRINANTATRQELMSLPQVGPDIADRILKLRPFANAADFEKRVTGISPPFLQTLQKRLEFEAGADCCVP